MPALALLPAVMSERLRDSPDVTNDVVVRVADALWDLLLAGEIGFSVTSAGFVFESPAPRAETVGYLPISFIVRAGPTLLIGECPGARFPVVRSSWSGLPLPPETKQRMRGVANVVGDFGTLAAIAAASDTIWFSSTYAVIEDLRSGRLCELPRLDDAETRGVDVILYSHDRRPPRAVGPCAETSAAPPNQGAPPPVARPAGHRSRRRQKIPAASPDAAGTCPSGRSAIRPRGWAARRRKCRTPKARRDAWSLPA